VVDLREAYASCERDARGHYENFPVASLLIPRQMRRHVAAVYAFARAADDFADEGQRSIDERCALLDGWNRRLQASVSGNVEQQAPPTPGEPSNAPEIFVALGASIADRQLPPQLFEDLLSAFRQDVIIHRYATWADVLDYCRRSANPIGRLVLRIAGYRSERLDGWSDAVCTALQLTNFWQDLKRDYDRGRIYLPFETMQQYGAREDDLAGDRIGSAWRGALGAAVARTRELFAAGRPIGNAVHGRLRYELRATWLGGMRILMRLEHAGYDVIRHRPQLGPSDLPWLAWQMTTWSA
jgi:phytoene synthase